jgi:hypothetical protein
VGVAAASGEGEVAGAAEEDAEAAPAALGDWSAQAAVPRFNTTSKAHSGNLFITSPLVV